MRLAAHDSWSCSKPSADPWLGMRQGTSPLCSILAVEHTTKSSTTRSTLLYDCAQEKIIYLLDVKRCELGSGPRYMISVTLFCTLLESKNLRPCENHTTFACDSLMAVAHAFRVWFSHGCRFCVWFSQGSRFFDSCNVQKRATKSDTSGHCLVWAGDWS